MRAWGETDVDQNSNIKNTPPELVSKSVLDFNLISTFNIHTFTSARDAVGKPNEG